MQNIAVAMQEGKPPTSAMFLSCTKQPVPDASRCKAPGITAQHSTAQHSTARHSTAQTTSPPFDQNTVSNSISNSLLPVMSVRKAVKLTKQPTKPPSRSGLFLPELGVPTTRSSRPLYRRSRTLKAANTVTNRLLPQRCANRLSCSTPFTGMVTCAPRTRPEPSLLNQQLSSQLALWQADCSHRAAQPQMLGTFHFSVVHLHTTTRSERLQYSHIAPWSPASTTTHRLLPQ